jgi:hypothetical protein
LQSAELAEVVIEGERLRNLKSIDHHLAAAVGEVPGPVGEAAKGLPGDPDLRRPQKLPRSGLAVQGPVVVPAGDALVIASAPR